MEWIVHKFGGTSVGSALCMKQCINIVKPLIDGNRVAVVVSAMGGKPKVTDLLIELVTVAASGNESRALEIGEEIRQKHETCIDELIGVSEISSGLMKLIQSDLRDISDLLKAVRLMKTAHEQIVEIVSGYGEVWSANILSEALKLEGLPFACLNAKDVLVVEEREALGVEVLWELSLRNLQNFLQKHLDKHLVITGFIASTIDGVPTTLKRDGSDYSASIFGKLLKSSSITIWTDVSGVYSADPRRVPDAQIIPDITYSEAIELAYFGAKVIHPKTMAPAIDAAIPIYIRNTFQPDLKGTRIFKSMYSSNHTNNNSKQTSNSCNNSKLFHHHHRAERAVCGFTTVDDITLMNIEGTGMIGVPGIAHRLFGALKTVNVSVMFIAQASSEHSICFATKTSLAQKAKIAIEEVFFYELKHGFISHIKMITDCSIIAAVGESMHHVPGVSGLFFNALGSASINILSISQGCDERNISAVVFTKDTTRALRAVHAAFWLSSLDLNIGIIGTGRVGSALLQLLLDQHKILGARFGMNIKLRGVANQRKMLLGEDVSEMLREKLSFFSSDNTIRDSNNNNNSSNSTNYKAISIGNTVKYNVSSDNVRKSRSNESLQDLEVAMTSISDDKIDTNLELFLNHLITGVTPHTIIIDATTSHEVAKLHPYWLRQGLHVVTANKRALSSSLELYNEVYSAMRSSNRLYMSEVTIGAALPIRTTLNDMLYSGDAIHEIVGLFSVSVGTVLTYVCDEKMSFSQAITKTYQQGLFEDDIYSDLTGMDAAEKLLVLGRELGIPLNIEDIVVEPLVQRKHVNIDWNQLGSILQDEDQYIAQRAEQALTRGNTLRYVQRIHCSPAAELGNNQKIQAKATVKLEEVSLDSHQALVKGPVYHFAFHTERYAQNPLIIQGPLSDSVNTASGMIGDIIRIARSIGAKDRGPETLVK